MQNRVREGYDTAREEVSRAYEGAEGLVSSHPSSSVLIGFGLGFGLGVLLTTILTRREETWGERYLPDSPRDFKVPDRVTRAAHEIPDSVHGSFHHLADAIRDLPSSIAQLVPHR